MRGYHKVTALIVIGLAVAYLYLRGPLLALMSVAAAIAILLGSTFVAEPALFLLPLMSEVLIKRNARVRKIVPLAIGLAAASVFSAYLLFRATTGSDILLGTIASNPVMLAIIPFLPWFAIASQYALASEASMQDGNHTVTASVTRGILQSVRSQLVSIPSPKEGVRALKLIAALDDIDGRVFAMSEETLHALREALMESQALLLNGNINAILDQWAPFQRKKPSAEDEAAFRSASLCVRQAVAVIHAYRMIVPKDYKRVCRFDPSCSHYAEQAILRHGFFRGCLLALKRSLKCVPNGAYGWDPVIGTPA